MTDTIGPGAAFAEVARRYGELERQYAALKIENGQLIQGVTLLEGVFRRAVYDIRRFAPSRAEVLMAEWVREMSRTFKRREGPDAQA